MRESPLPPEFEELSGIVHYVVERTRGKEWSSSCPHCGGEPHPRGDFPDRFRMWPVSKYGKPLGWCRCCGKVWTKKTDYIPDPAKIEAWKAERIADAERRLSETQQELKLLRDEHAWQEWHSWLKADQLAQQHWRAAGIQDPYWWGEWQLGYNPSKTFNYDSADEWQKHTTAVMTIPVRNLQGEIVNIKMRLINPMPDGTKYRMYRRVGVEPCFVTNLDLCNTADTALVCEGEKKAMVTFLTLDNPNLQVFGLPKSPSEEILSSIKAQTIYYIPDPDVERPARFRVLKAWKGRDVRIVELPQAIDDYILECSLGKQNVERWLRDARKA